MTFIWWTRDGAQVDIFSWQNTDEKFNSISLSTETDLPDSSEVDYIIIIKTRKKEIYYYYNTTAK